MRCLRPMATRWLLVGVAALCLPSAAAETGTEAPAAAVAALGEEFMREFFSANPGLGTRAGLHEHDAALDDLSRAALESAARRYRSIEERLAAVPADGLDAGQRADRELLLARIRAAAFDIDANRWWDRDPRRYLSIASDGVFVLIGREHAPAAERLRTLTARLAAMPRLFAAAQENLANAPRIHVEVAIRELPGIVAFFENDVPRAFAAVDDAALRAEFGRANAAAVQSLREYRVFLQEGLLPRANADYRLGPERLARKLEYEEMIDLPLATLRAAGRADLERNQREFARVAQLLDPAATPAEILARLQRRHPAADGLLEAFRAQLEGMREFVETNRIVGVPSRTLPVLQDTPPALRAVTSASMDTPGPFETRATTSYFNVTPVDSALGAEAVEEYLQGFSDGVIASTALHEVIPGHFLQYLWNERVESRIRRFAALDMSFAGGRFALTNSEGWAHYIEEMMLEEGYGRTPGVPEEDDDAYLELKLGQLQDALLRNARYVVAIEMHAGDMSFQQAVEFFQREGYQPRPSAEKEALRGTSDPTYLVYTLGKLQLRKLRADVERAPGDAFSLQDFHDRVMLEGVVPIRLIRRAMLGEDSASL